MVESSIWIKIVTAIKKQTNKIKERRTNKYKLLKPGVQRPLPANYMFNYIHSI